MGIIHFATHGELSETDPLSSAVLLVPGEGEDGRLEVREVFGAPPAVGPSTVAMARMSHGSPVVGSSVVTFCSREANSWSVILSPRPFSTSSMHAPSTVHDHPWSRAGENGLAPG